MKRFGDLTARETKDVAIALWEDMAEHGYMDKNESVLYEDYNIYDMQFECPLCDYHKECKDCILYKKAGNIPCGNHGSLYRLWLDTTKYGSEDVDFEDPLVIADRKAIAKAIVKDIRKWRV